MRQTFSALSIYFFEVEIVRFGQVSETQINDVRRLRNDIADFARNGRDIIGIVINARANNTNERISQFHHCPFIAIVLGLSVGKCEHFVIVFCTVQTRIGCNENNDSESRATVAMAMIWSMCEKDRKP